MLAGKIALVTGAGSGIGRATSLLIAREGAKVIITDQNKKSLDETLTQLKGDGHSSYTLDVTNAELVAQTFKNIVKNYETPPNIVINSAGITRDSFLLNMTQDMFKNVIDVNLTGTYNVVKSACVALNEYEHSGSIVNIASIVGQTGNMAQVNYSASKAGVEALSKTVAKEMGKLGIRCNAVVPGFIESPMTDLVPEKVKNLFLARIPLGRLGKPEGNTRTSVCFVENCTININQWNYIGRS
uniref:Putative mitochondrial/plastidial beta-ketoacyl-acp reductase n=1 Tax=Panstrongylus lignarius TaxID=156445 RepID=A0A224XIX0_9HEMI